MTEIGRGDPNDVEAASKETPPSAAPTSPRESSLTSVLHQLGWLTATGIVGALIGYCFQQRAWNNERAVAKIQKDTDAAFGVGQKASEFIDARWAAAEQVRAALQSHASEKELEQARDRYFKNVEVSLPNVAKLQGEIAFHVDAPFERPVGDIRKEIYKINCLSFTLDPMFDKDKNLRVDPQAGSHLLQIIDHCHGLVKDDVAAVIAAKYPVKPYAPCNKGRFAQAPNGIEERVCHIKVRTSHIWWLNNVLRCTILRRAMAIRDTGIRDTAICGASLLEKLNCFWEKYVIARPPSKYELTQDEIDLCVKDYREDRAYGSASSRERLHEYGAPYAVSPAQ
jgi:hypothetical protein